MLWALKWGLGTALILYMAYAALMVWLHPRFIYPFSPEPFDAAPYQRHDLPNGPTVYVHDAGSEAPLVVYFMGNVGALTPFLPMLDHHRAAGRSVVAMGYRGGGGLPGTPSEDRLKADALLAFDAARALVTKPASVTVQGYSLGIGLALHVAARRAPDGVILSAPYQKLCRLMAARGRVPACLLPGVQKWRSHRDAARLGIDSPPILILHGTEDALVPIIEGRRLLRSFGPKGLNSQFIEIPGAAHNDLMSFPLYLTEIDRFIAILGGAAG